MLEHLKEIGRQSAGNRPVVSKKNDENTVDGTCEQRGGIKKSRGRKRAAKYHQEETRGIFQTCDETGRI